MRRTNSYTAGEDLPLDQKNFMGITLLFLLAINFTLGYLAHTYYPKGLLDPNNTGFWITAGNYAFLGGIVLLNKYVLGLQWKDLGLGKPDTWWKPLITALAVFTGIVLFSMYLQPYIFEAFGRQQNLDHLKAMEGDLQWFIVSLVFLWIFAGFLEELVFRGFMINTLEKLLGNNLWSTLASVIISSLIFGMIHAYQGITGMLVNASMGAIFGLAFILNGRRIWPLVFIHGLVETLALISFYNGTA